MHVYELRNTKGAGAVTLVEREYPSVGAEQALIEMRAVALNYRDLLVINGSLYPNSDLPIIPLSDGVGRVTAVGRNVTRVQPGDRVAGIFVQNWLSGEAPREAITLGGQGVDGVVPRPSVNTGHFRVPSAFGLAAFSLPRPSCGWETPQ